MESATMSEPSLANASAIGWKWSWNATIWPSQVMPLGTDSYF